MHASKTRVHLIAENDRPFLTRCIARHGDPCRYLRGLPPVSTHPVVGRASVGARASCLPSHRTRVRSARRGCH